LHSETRGPFFQRVGIGVIALAMTIVLSGLAFAEVQTLTATGTYKVGKYDTRADAQYLALLDARPHAIEHAVAYLENAPAVKQAGISRDKLTAYAMVLADFQDQAPSDMNPVGATAAASITIKIDPDTLEGRLQVLLENERAKAEVTRASDKIERYRKEVESDSKRLTTLSVQSEVDKVLQHRRDMLDLIETESQLARTWGTLLAAQGARRPPAPKGAGPSARTPSAQSAGPGSENAEEHRKKGVSLNKEGQYDQAITEFRAALQLVPNLPRGHLGLGAALQGKGDLEGAITEYGTELKAHPNDGDTYNNLGTAFQRKGDLEGAISQYRRAIRLNPDDPLAHYNLGTALTTKGETEEGITEYRAAVRAKPDFAEAHLELGSALKTKGQMSEAAEALRRFLDLAPDIDANKQYIEQARKMLGEIAEKGRRQRRPTP